MTYYCPNCGSKDVEELLVAWFHANDSYEEPDPVEIAKAYPEPYWCNYCETHPIRLVTTDPQTARSP